MPVDLPAGGASIQPEGSSTVQEVAIRDDGIRLGQFLKLAGLAESGADAKALLAAGHVTVNGIGETRRGRQLLVGDEVALGDDRARVTSTQPADGVAVVTEVPGAPATLEGGSARDDL